MAMSATRPKSLGASILARAMVTPNWISCVPARSKNFQKREDMITRLSAIIYRWARDSYASRYFWVAALMSKFSCAKFQAASVSMVISLL